MSTPSLFAAQTAPVFLRVALGLTFLWFGVGQFASDIQVVGTPAATLANMGVQTLQKAAAPASDRPVSPVSPEREPLPPNRESPAPSSSSPAVPVSGSSPPPLAKVTSQPIEQTEPGDRAPSSPSTTPSTTPTPSSPSTQSPSAPASAPLSPSSPTTDSGVRSGAGGTSGVGASAEYDAADFVTPIAVARVNQRALLIASSAAPGQRVDGSAASPLLPSALGISNRPLLLAWTWSIVEIVAGSMLLVGLFTRFHAFAAFLCTCIAIWLTTIGPVVQSGTAQLGFLPQGSLWALDASGEFAFGRLLWFLLMACGCLSLTLLGGGYVSMDRVFSSSRTNTSRGLAASKGMPTPDN